MSDGFRSLNRMPDHVPRTSTGFSGQIPVRFEGAPGGPMEGQSKWRGVREFDHGHLCRVFNLDPVRFHFDLPSCVRGIGANMSGIAGAARAGRRRISGFVFMAGCSDPVAKLTICFESGNCEAR